MEVGIRRRLLLARWYWIRHFDLPAFIYGLTYGVTCIGALLYKNYWVKNPANDEHTLEHQSLDQANRKLIYISALVVAFGVLTHNPAGMALAPAGGSVLASNARIHVVAEGEDIDTLADLYNTTPASIRQLNDLPDSKNDLKKGDTLRVLGRDIDNEEAGQYASADLIAYLSMDSESKRNNENDDSQTRSSTPEPVAQNVTQNVSNNPPVYAGNRYAWGHCTWHVANLRAQAGEPIPSFWGDAGYWGSSARNDGYVVNQTPKPGSIAWQAHGIGHVAYVTGISGDTVHVKEMFGYGGNGIPQQNSYHKSHFNGYIH